MCVDRGVACCASQVLVLPIRNVLVRAGVSVLLGQAKVNDVDQVALLAKAHEEVVGLDVTMDEVLGVDVLDAANLRTHRCDREAQVLRWRESQRRHVVSLRGRITFHMLTQHFTCTPSSRCSQ